MYRKLLIPLALVAALSLFVCGIGRSAAYQMATAVVER
jgi:hypothetical protein